MSSGDSTVKPQDKPQIIKNIIINSGGGTKGLYTTLGVFMGLNEAGYLNQIEAITYNGHVTDREKIKAPLRELIKAIEDKEDLSEILELVEILCTECF